MARWISETVLITQLEVKQGRWVIGNIGFTRYGQEHLTKLARGHCHVKCSNLDLVISV